MGCKCPDAKPDGPCPCQLRLVVVDRKIVELTTERTGLQQDIHDLENCPGTDLQSWRRRLASVEARLKGLQKEKDVLTERLGILVS